MFPTLVLQAKTTPKRGPKKTTTRKKRATKKSAASAKSLAQLDQTLSLFQWDLPPSELDANLHNFGLDLFDSVEASSRFSPTRHNEGRYVPGLEVYGQALSLNASPEVAAPKTRTGRKRETKVPDTLIDSAEQHRRRRSGGVMPVSSNKDNIHVRGGTQTKENLTLRTSPIPQLSPTSLFSKNIFRVSPTERYILSPTHMDPRMVATMHVNPTPVFDEEVLDSISSAWFSPMEGQDLLHGRSPVRSPM